MRRLMVWQIPTNMPGLPSVPACYVNNNFRCLGQPHAAHWHFRAAAALSDKAHHCWELVADCGLSINVA